MSYQSYEQSAKQFPPLDGGGASPGGGSGPVEGTILLARSVIYADITDLVGGVDVCTNPTLTVVTANSFAIEKPAGSVIEVSADSGVTYFAHPTPITLSAAVCTFLGPVGCRLRVVGTTNYVETTLIVTDNNSACTCP